MIKEKKYISILQSFGLLGVTILISLLFSPIIIVLQNKIELELIEFIYYIITIIPTIWIFTKVKKKYTSNIISIKKLSILSTILTVICGITLTLGVVFPITDLMPSIPDFMASTPTAPGIWTLLLMILIAPICEEYLYRGVILDGLLAHYKPIVAILISSVIFGLVHLNPWQFIAGFIIGLLAGYIYLLYKNLIMNILLHTIVNLIGYIQILYIENIKMFDKYTDLYNAYGNAIIIIASCLVLFSISVIFLYKHAQKTTGQSPSC